MSETIQLTNAFLKSKLTDTVCGRSHAHDLDIPVFGVTYITSETLNKPPKYPWNGICVTFSVSPDSFIFTQFVIAEQGSAMVLCARQNWLGKWSAWNYLPMTK